MTRRLLDYSIILILLALLMVTPLAKLKGKSRFLKEQFSGRGRAVAFVPLPDGGEIQLTSVRTFPIAFTRPARASGRPPRMRRGYIVRIPFTRIEFRLPWPP